MVRRCFLLLPLLCSVTQAALTQSNPSVEEKTAGPSTFKPPMKAINNPTDYLELLTPGLIFEIGDYLSLYQKGFINLLHKKELFLLTKEEKARMVKSAEKELAELEQYKNFNFDEEVFKVLKRKLLAKEITSPKTKMLLNKFQDPWTSKKTICHEIEKHHNWLVGWWRPRYSWNDLSYNDDVIRARDEVALNLRSDLNEYYDDIHMDEEIKVQLTNLGAEERNQLFRWNSITKKSSCKKLSAEFRIACEISFVVDEARKQINKKRNCSQLWQDIRGITGKSEGYNDNEWMVQILQHLLSKYNIPRQDVQNAMQEARRRVTLENAHKSDRKFALGELLYKYRETGRRYVKSFRWYSEPKKLKMLLAYTISSFEEFQDMMKNAIQKSNYQILSILWEDKRAKDVLQVGYKNELDTDVYTNARIELDRFVGKLGLRTEIHKIAPEKWMLEILDANP